MQTLKTAIVIFLLSFQSAFAQDERPKDPALPPNRFAELQKKLGKLTSMTQQLGDWGAQSELARSAVGKVFERAGWDSQEDLFAFEVFRAVDSRPPWAMQERADTFFSLLSERYQLNDEQREKLKELFFRESLTLFVNHSDAILSYSTEALEARIAGKPFTPEQVARWTKLAEPVMNDGFERMSRSTEEFMEDLSPEQRDLVQADLKAADRRINGVREMMQEWKQGRWEASDWGIEEDPIQTGKAAAAKEGVEPPIAEEVAEPPVAPPKAEPPDRKEPETPVPPRETPPPTNRESPPAPAGRDTARQPTNRNPGTSDPWAKYVQAFIDKYKLEDAQRQKAWVCYDQTKDRIEQNEAKLKSDSSGDKQPNKALLEKHEAELERTFSQLKLRLERLPTRQQRRDASPGEIPSPIAKAVATSRPSKRR